MPADLLLFSGIYLFTESGSDHLCAQTYAQYRFAGINKTGDPCDLIFHPGMNVKIEHIHGSPHDDKQIHLKRIWNDLPASRKVFHWHGDTFPIPKNATRIASTMAFPNQGFIYKGKVIALQFHLEVTASGVRDLVENCRDELLPGPFIQREEEILAEENSYLPNQELMFRLLDYLRDQVI